MADILKAMKLGGVTCLIGIKDLDANVYKSARNIPGVEVMPASQFNTYTVLRQKRLVLTRAALDELRNPAKKTAETGAAAAKA
jgi:large subunit ribosomal protein L4